MDAVAVLFRNLSHLNLDWHFTIFIHSIILTRQQKQHLQLKQPQPTPVLHLWWMKVGCGWGRIKIPEMLTHSSVTSYDGSILRKISFHCFLNDASLMIWLSFVCLFSNEDTDILLLLKWWRRKVGSFPVFAVTFVLKVELTLPRNSSSPSAATCTCVIEIFIRVSRP